MGKGYKFIKTLDFFIRQFNDIISYYVIKLQFFQRKYLRRRNFIKFHFQLVFDKYFFLNENVQ